MHTTSTLILIGGLPGTGKTTFTKLLAKELRLPYICKDEFKEILFDSLGWSDREWSKKLGLASYKLIDYVLEKELAAGHSIIIESNFKAEFDNARFQEWQKKYNYKAIQVICETEGTVLYERFKNRAFTPERHPGHTDDKNHEEFKDSLLYGKALPLDIEGEVITIDTTDFGKVDYPGLTSQIKDLL